MPKPLSDDEVETLLHDLARRIAETPTLTDAGREALKVAFTGPYAALLMIEKRKITSPDDA